MTARTSAQLQILRAENLKALDWLSHGFSTRVGGFSSPYGGGALNLGFTKEDMRDAVERNRAAFIEALRDGRPHTLYGGGSATRPARVKDPGPHKKDPGLHKKDPGLHKPYKPEVWPIIGVRQIHSDVIHKVDRVPEQPPAGDGLITSTPGLLLTVRTADCIPVLVADPKRRAVGAFHAGWRGTVKRIVEKGVGEMRRYFGSDPADMLAAIGPGIHRCCYEVGEEVRDQFASQFAYADALFDEHRADSDVVHERYPLLFLTARAPGHSELPKKILLDLAEANRRQLLDTGVAEANIVVLNFCTSCRTDLFFSYRKEGPTGRMMGAIGITDF